MHGLSSLSLIHKAAFIFLILVCEKKCFIWVRECSTLFVLTELKHMLANIFLADGPCRRIFIMSSLRSLAFGLLAPYVFIRI